jgi:GT2 family glycosyltransferase
MRLSYVLISFDRREALLSTLLRLSTATPLPADQWEIIVIDNASTDGSADAVGRMFPKVRLVRNERNIGMPARNRGFAMARGEFIITLDDDSFPAEPLAVSRMLAHMDANPQCAAVVARVILPDGSAEAPALPAVLLGGASCLRRSALVRVGGFCTDFFRQAEEYDLSFRIWAAGFTIDRFEDILFRHDKVAGPGRSSPVVCRMDLRNNLIVAGRFLPPNLWREYRRDWSLRYAAIARSAGHRQAARLGTIAGLWRSFSERLRATSRLDPQSLELIFGLDRQKTLVAEWSASRGMKYVAIADFGKNLFATYSACRAAGLIVTAIADDNPAFAGLLYRDLPILPLAEALTGSLDGVILSNINPAQIDGKAKQIRDHYAGPLLRLWQPRYVQIPVFKRAAAA